MSNEHPHSCIPIPTLPHSPLPILPLLFHPHPTLPHSPFLILPLPSHPHPILPHSPLLILPLPSHSLPTPHTLPCQYSHSSSTLTPSPHFYIPIPPECTPLHRFQCQLSADHSGRQRQWSTSEPGSRTREQHQCRG